MLGKAERPLLYCGGGVINGEAAPELRAFAERFGIPVVTTLMGIGAIDTTSDLSLQMLGMHGMAYANYAVEDCDFLFAVGSRFDDRVAGKVKEFAPHATILHLDIDASEIEKVKHVDWAHVADAKRGLPQLQKAGAGFKKDFRRWREHVARAEDPPRPRLRHRVGGDPGRIRAAAAERDHQGRGDRHDRRRAAPDVGGAVHRLQAPAHVPHVGQHGDHGFRAAGGDRGADRQSREARHRRRRRRLAYA